ncbi:DUF2336 domain-containing protein [Microvirga tunisiensis]|uniref:DUF2336 domain-containing protein n=1 Tax=Pannonibacter tanglangensis TaxID=2750084 RepID=A0A7X5F0A1_9HYPH|nr:DUF2336 domain-containing protein [Pannonibacter sp. XCT-53]NBN77134.1 DUF2336 domain-containing protein [Pannonibacter sp. XCT-53]
MLRERLEQLARNKDAAARSELIRTLGAEYANPSSPDPTPMERELFSALVLDVFHQLDRPTRYDLVVRLARTNRITSPLADRLAQEDYELSEPVLEFSPTISQQALRTIVTSRSDRHRSAIARRPDLPEDLVDTMIARSGRGVTHVLLTNPATRFSPRAILALLIFANVEAPVLAGIARRALQDPVFHADLCTILEAQCPLVPPELAKAMEAEDLEPLARRALADGKALDINVNGQTMSYHEAHVQIASGELSFDSILLTLIDQNRQDACVWLIARKIGLVESTIAKILRSEADSAVTNMMRETGIEYRTFRKFLEARCVWFDKSPRTIPDEVLRFRTGRRAPSV